MATLVEQTLSRFFPPPLRASLLFDALLALVVHGIYNKYEIKPANILATFLLLVGVPALPCYLLIESLGSIVLALVISYLIFYFTLALSIILYRLSPVHPLAQYPGPLSLKISKFAAIYYAAGGKQHGFFKRLHDKYGPFVRVGPNELSVIDVDAVNPIFKLEKGPMWDAHSIPGTPPVLAAIRNIEEHNERRRLWTHAFTTQSLKDFQPLVENRILELMEQLDMRVSNKSAEKEVTLDLAQWLSNFQFDFMGDLVFGGGFGLLKDSSKGEMQTVIDEHMKVITLLGHTSWITGLLHKVAAVPEGPRRLLELASQRYDMRKAQGTAKRDLFHYITNEEGLEKMEVSRAQGINDILGAMIGGTDNTTTVLSGVFYYLLSNQSAFDRLRKEVDSEFPRDEGEPFDTARLAKMPYLNAVINEALRLQPPGPTEMQRSLPKGRGGKFIAGSFIPGNTAIYVAPYVIHRDSRYFSPRPDSFIPERWLDTPNGEKFTTNVSAFIPFSSGPANCVGKSLAWMEMRMIVATIVQRFNMKFGEGYDPRKWEEDLEDFLAMKVGELPVVLYKRT